MPEATNSIPSEIKYNVKTLAELYKFVENMFMMVKYITFFIFVTR